MFSGYIKLHRRLLEHPLFRRPGFVHIWTWCLLKTTWRRNVLTYLGEDVELAPGEFIFGRALCAKETGLREKQVRNLIDLLVAEGMIKARASKRASRFTVYAVANWHEYQELGPAKGPAEGQQKRRRGGQQGSKDSGGKGASKRDSIGASLNEEEDKEPPYSPPAKQDSNPVLTFEQMAAIMEREGITTDTFAWLRPNQWRKK